MMKLLSAPLLALALFATPLQVFAWAAAADNGVGGEVIHYNADRPEEAARLAVEQCQKTGHSCKLSVDPVEGTAIVVARGEGGWGTAARPDPKEAAAAALKACSEVAKRCRVVNAAWDLGRRWLAYEQGKDAFNIQVNAETRERAIQAAIAGCERNTSEKGSCKVADTDVSGARYFVALAASAQRGTSASGLSSKSMREAEAQALQLCASPADKPKDCAVVNRNVNEGPLAEPASMKAVEAMMQQKPKNVAPAAGGQQTRPQPPTARPRCINPATGFPMTALDGSCAGFDVAGNPYGFKNR